MKIKELEKEVEELKGIAWKQKQSCFVCGNKNITIHHIKDINSKKKDKKSLKGTIPLCRKCHDIVEDIVNKGKSKKLWFQRGYEKGLQEGQFKNLLHKDNHIIGCMIEGYANVLEFRGFEEEARIIENVASRIK